MNILLIGNGAREHAIAEAFCRSSHKPKVYSFMKTNNPGIKGLSAGIFIGKYSDLEGIKKFAKDSRADFAFIGPEDPLNNGVVDALENSGIPCVGPRKNLASLETSKSFTRLIMEKYNIPGNPKFKVFKHREGIKKFLEELEEVVIKPDGLTAGKGVKVQGDHFNTKEEAYNYCIEVLKDHPAVIVEEKLDGEEFSLQCLTDGYTVKATPVVQDHKRAFVGDKGPNTGGMGSYSCADHLLPFLAKEDVEAALDITSQVCNALRKEAGVYSGVMYGGFMVTKEGVKLIEYNARFGDPETMNVLPILKTDFVDVCLAIVNRKLNSIKLEFEKKATVCKYAVPEGYPDNPVNNKKIDISNVPKNARLYFASVDKREDGLYMSSSRAIGVVGISSSLDEAERIAENAVSAIKGPVYHRKDIGTMQLIKKRIDHMKRLR
ncbi:MAG TPA: phosphoribosylamine--glycine ligase [Candidatus Nanoarchaeia archaeon]|nr:phosphoribosylamine--glycine ligase [Candidatus Nanoarchaeia archaeon]